MQTLRDSYPPPLSSPPTVETLERLLEGLSGPLDAPAPAPPVVDPGPAALFEGEGHGAEERAAIDVPAAPDTSTTAAPAPPQSQWQSPILTWSAHHGSVRHRRLTTVSPRARVVATVVAAAAAAAVAAGVGLP